MARYVPKHRKRTQYRARRALAGGAAMVAAITVSFSGSAGFVPVVQAQEKVNPFVAERQGNAAGGTSPTVPGPAATGAAPVPSASGVAPETGSASTGSPIAVAPAIDPRTARIPEFIDIPAINTTSSLIQLGLNLDGTLEVPVDFGQAGWFSGGVAPGEDGPAIIAGHVDSYKGPAIFARLDELKPGDRVRIARADGVKVEFSVTRVDRYPKDYFPTDQVYGPTDGPELRLITCGGVFDTKTHSYKDNTVVYARLLTGT